jgi:hypothetical protein
MRNRLATTAATALLAASILGCEAGTTPGYLISGPTSSARVRVFNAVTTSAAVDFLVDGQVAATGIAFGAPSGYVTVPFGSHRLQVRAAVTGTILVDFTRDFAAAGSFSLIPAPGLGQSGALVTSDDPTPAAGQTKVRLINVAAAAGPVSVYVTAPDADLTSATPSVPLLPFGVASDYVTRTPGSYRIRFTRAGSPNEVLLDTGGVTFDAGSVRSLVLTDSPGGGLPTTMSNISDAN